MGDARAVCLDWMDVYGKPAHGLVREVGRTMVQKWVIKRELARSARHLKFPLFAIAAPIQRYLHDRSKARNSRFTPGLQSRGAQLALYLLHQKDALLASTFETCKHLAAKGFSTLIVSNTALSDADRQALAPYCFAMIERPNFGYDFGGYRDGILWLLDNPAPVKRLLLLNDSVWFPTLPGEDFLAQFLASDCDLYGAIMSQRKRHVSDRYVQSYAFGFSGKLVGTALFKHYWQHLNLQSDREWTIRRCERKMTAVFRSAGYKIGARWDFPDVAVALAQMSDSDLISVLQLEAKLEQKRGEVIGPIIARHGQPGWRTEVEAYINSAKFRKFILLLHPSVWLPLNFPFLKKSKERRFSQHRPYFIKSVGPECNPIMLAEIARWDGEAATISEAVSQTADREV